MPDSRSGRQKRASSFRPLRLEPLECRTLLSATFPAIRAASTITWPGDAAIHRAPSITAAAMATFPAIGRAIAGPRPAAAPCAASHALPSSALPAPVLHFSPTPIRKIIPSDGVALDTAGPTGMTPAQIRHAYGIDSITFNGVAGDGTGTTIAIVDAYDDPNIANDLHQFDLAYGLARSACLHQGQPDRQHDQLCRRPMTAGPPKSPWTSSGPTPSPPGPRSCLVEANSDSDADLYTAVDYARNYTTWSPCR